MKILYTTLLLFITSTTHLFSSSLSTDEYNQQEVVFTSGSLIDHSNTMSYLANGKMLRIEGYNISDIIPALAEKHPNVTNLCLISCGRLLTKDLTDIGLFKHLRHLKLMNCGITNVTSLHLVTRHFANALFTLDISYHEINDDGILGILKLATLSNLKRLCIWNNAENDKLTEVTINALCHSSLSAQLETFCFSCFKSDRSKITKATNRIWLKKNKEYYLFYDSTARDNDVFMLDNPAVFGLHWICVKGQWYLSNTPPETSSHSSEAKLKHHKEYQFYLEWSSEDDSQNAFEEAESNDVQFFSSDTEN